VANIIGKVPRGFTRFYVLHLLTERPMTGKEIMNEAEKRSEGVWKPSPGLIYPLLGRLAKRELIEETEDGRFTITPDGESTLQKYTLIQKQLEGQIRMVRQLGLSLFSVGKILAEDALDRIMSVTDMVQETVGKSSKDLQKSFYDKYKAFLESELERIEKKQPQRPEEAAEPS